MLPGMHVLCCRHVSAELGTCVCRTCSFSVAMWVPIVLLFHVPASQADYHAETLNMLLKCLQAALLVRSPGVPQVHEM